MLIEPLRNKVKQLEKQLQTIENAFDLEHDETVKELNEAIQKLRDAEESEINRLSAIADSSMSNGAPRCHPTIIL